MMGYENAERVPGGPWLLWGGKNPLPYIQATGDTAPQAAAVLRAQFAHRVSRADVCLDLDRGDPGLFDELQALIDPLARPSGVSVRMIHDPSPTSEKGRTIYFGAMKSSDVIIRVYEKGKEQIETGANPDASPTWVRVELVVRPRKDRKDLAATIPADELFGFSKWSSRVYEALMSQAIPRHPDTSIKLHHDQIVFGHMVRQYGPLIRRLVEADGWGDLEAALYRALWTPKERGSLEKDPDGPVFSPGSGRRVQRSRRPLAAEDNA